MRPAITVLALALGLAAPACVENTAPGNDREAELDAAVTPAPVARAGEAISGVATGLLIPETMSDSDRRDIPDLGRRCTFRMTEVGFPVLVYGASAVVKLNGKLVPLPGTGEGRYAADGVEASIRPLGDGGGRGEQFPAEFVLRLPGGPDELGYHGFSECGAP